MSEEVIVLFQAPVITKPEFRLYYDIKGNVLFYTTEKLPGNYIVVDAKTYAEARHDLKIFNNEIIRDKQTSIVEKLVKTTDVGVATYKHDVSIIVVDDFTDKQYWSSKINEYR